MRIRPRRNRKSAAIRDMVEETRLTVSDFMYPMFLLEGNNRCEPVDSMPGINRLSLDLMLVEIEECLNIGVNSFDIFPVVDEKYKDKKASKSHDADFFYISALSEIKQRFPETCIMTDVALDPYNSDGHDGLVSDTGEIVNDETLVKLGKMALVQAQTGVDIIGPSDMMDGRVGYIRNILDKEGFTSTSIMSYTAKYASAFYGPFRDALDSAPKSGDKKTYQMNPANIREAMIEAELDTAEGADFLMVKPALAYLDVIYLLSQQFHLPITAYNVSGEYAMISAAGEKGWLDKESAMLESLLSIKRAGAKVILSYFAKEVALLLK